VNLLLAKFISPSTVGLIICDEILATAKMMMCDIY